MKNRGIRITLTRDELMDYYALLGGKIGTLRDGLAIRDGRASEIVMEVAAILGLQDRIGKALQTTETEGEANERRPSYGTRPRDVLRAGAAGAGVPDDHRASGGGNSKDGTA